MSDSLEDFILPSSQELKKAAEAENTKCEMLTIEDSNNGGSEKENESGKASFKSVPKIHRTSLVVDETEKEMKYRRKYFKDESEVITSWKLRCTACCSSLQSVVLEGRDIYQHPVLKVLMCKACNDFYGDGNFSVDEDGSDKYCRWCGQGGMLYCCSTCCCAFCRRCIKRNLNRSILTDIESEDWQCFVCNEEPLWELRAVCVNAQLYSKKTQRNRHEENQRNRKQLLKKQTSLKQKSLQLYRKQRSSRLDSSSDDDSSSNKKQEPSKNRRKRNNGSPVNSDGGKKVDKKQKLKDSDSDVIEIERPKRYKVECVQLSDTEESGEDVKNEPITDNSTSVSDSGGDSHNEEGDSDDSKKKKRHKKKSKRRFKLTFKEGRCNRGDVMGTEKGTKLKSKERMKHPDCGSAEDIIDKKLPKVLDETSAKLACDWLEEHSKDLATVGKALALRAERCLEKEVSLKAMTNPENVDKVVNNLQLLMKLAGENLEQIDGFLSLHHKYWVRRVIRHSSTKRPANVSGCKQQDHDNNNKNSITENNQGKEDVSVSMNGIGGKDLELHSLTGNESDNGGNENRETGKQQSDILSAETRKGESKKRKLLEEGNDSDDREVVNSGENERYLQKSVIRDKKRKKLEDELEIGRVNVSSDMFVDSDVSDAMNYTTTSENCKREGDCAVNRSSKEETDMGLEDVLEEVAFKDTCTVKTQDGGDTEIDKITVKDKNLNGDSSQKEEGNVTKKNTEDISLQHETADRLDLSRTCNDDDDDDSTLYGVDRESVNSFESLTTVQLSVENHLEKSVLSVEETLQGNQSRKSYEQDYKKSNSESEGEFTCLIKNEDGGEMAAVGEGSTNVENEKVSEKNSDTDAATIECLFNSESEKNHSSDDDGNKEEEQNSVESLADDSKSNVKRNPEENKKIGRELESNEVPDDVEKNALATIGSDDVIMEGSKEGKGELEIQKHTTEENTEGVEENKMDPKEDPKGVIEKNDEEKEKLESDDEDKSSDIGKLELSNDISDCEGKEEDSEKDKVEVNEDKVGQEDEVEKETMNASICTAESVKALQALLEYTADDEDSCMDTPRKKKRRKEQLKKENEKEVAVCEDSKPAEKRTIGPKSRTCKGKKSSISSVSSASDTDSECSTGRQITKVNRVRKKKFNVKDTEAYKQDEKLGWKCTVIVERLPDEVFQKHYERYYSDEEDETEKKAKDDKEIDSLVNLKSLEKVRSKKSYMDDSDTEDSDDQIKKWAKKKTKKDKKKEEEQKLIDFFNRMDDSDDYSFSSGAPDSEKEAMKAMRIKKKSFLEKENEMAMAMLLGSSTDEDDDDSSEKQDNLDQEKNNERKGEEKMEETESILEKEEEKEENSEEKEQKTKEEKADSGPSDNDDNFSDDSQKSLRQKKRDWRRNKLLTERLSDLDSSDEERRWKAKKEREQMGDDKKKKVRRRILGSDDDDSDVIISDHSSSDDFITKKRKKPSKKSNDDKDKTSDSDVPRKIKRKRIKAPANDSSSSEEDQVESSQKGDTPGKGRKNIHRIMKDENVGEATRRAAREEEERRKRISEKQKLYNEIYKEVEGTEKIDKLVLDFNPETKEELVSVDPYIVSKLKPHQVKGVKFMWDACFESLKQTEKTKGSGCILAHCMGLGKTFQVVTLVHTLLNHKDTKVKTVLVVCPLSTVLNWVNEFSMWLKDIGDGGEVNVFELSKYKQNYERMYQLKEWQDCGGVMMIGYDMFRNLTNTQTKRMRKKAIEVFQSTLVDPGPDLVVCDEGHMLKNEDTALAKAMKRIRTLRRIVLTGTPLQNNLKEYHCMVQFVKPNLLGTRKEFLNRFVNPISNGQFEDSTAHDVKIMKRRAHVLHKMLEGSVQRFDYSVLTPFLPPKHEYVISIRLCEVQIKAYRYYLEHYAMGKSGEKTKGAQLFNDFQNLSRIWTHPRVLQMNAEKAERTAEKKRLMEDSEGSLRDFIDDDDDNDDDDDDDETRKSSDNSSSCDSDTQVAKEGEGNIHKSTSRNMRSTRSKGLVEEPEAMEVSKEDEEDKKSNPLAWWKQFIEGDELDNIKYSGKLILLFSILRECEKIGDKVLVFSQSLYSLDLIEYFLSCIDTATQDGKTRESLGNNTGSWSIGLDYFRLDGSTSAENRNIWCRAFNREDNHRARLFIISTRAGGLGINLFAANRVVIFDASWNPSHDVQSIFRVYRFGQKKPCYIYRFLAQGTMEEKIYDRQVTKLSLSCRVVDEQQIERHYNMADLQELYQFDPEQKTKRPTPILPKDRLLAELLKEHEQWIVTYHEHDSLLVNKEEEELNEEERKAAWEEYENEKQGKIIPAVTTGTPTLNIAAIREALRKENPHVTEEQLELKLNVIMNQIYEYMNSSQSGMQTSNYQYTAAQFQALQQFKIQQEQLIRAQQQQQQEKLRLQQENAMRAAANYSNSNIPFKPYLKDQTQTSQTTAAYPTNLYRNIAMDKSGIFRLQSKLVPVGPQNTSSRSLLQNFGGKDIGGNQVISRQPVILPMSRPSTSMIQPPPAHSSNKELSEFLKHYNIQQPVGKRMSVSDDVIETID